MNGTGPLLLTITPYKVIRDFVVFEAHVIPCPVYDGTHNDSSITISIFNKQTNESFYWIKNKDVISVKDSPVSWKQEFNNVDDITNKGYFIVPNKNITIGASVLMDGYSCLNEQDINIFDVYSYMSNEPGYYYHVNGVVFQWKKKDTVISTHAVDRGIIVIPDNMNVADAERIYNTNLTNRYRGGIL
tara:strand:+ start:3498 stop:4058 length:561 start_codon:yes stop_codon:yes gene_type:complete